MAGPRIRLRGLSLVAATERDAAAVGAVLVWVAGACAIRRRQMLAGAARRTTDQSNPPPCLPPIAAAGWRHVYSAMRMNLAK